MSTTNKEKIIKKNKENSRFNFVSLSPKNLKRKKASLIEKLTEIIKHKYAKRLKQFNHSYNEDTIVKDLKEYLTDDRLSNFELNNFLSSFEEILNRKLVNISKIGNSEELNRIQYESQSCNFQDNNLDVNLSNRQKSIEYNFYSSPYDKTSKLEQLKNVKEKDDWGILAKKEYEKFLVESKNKKYLEETKNKEVNEYLHKQISEKNKLHKLMKDQDKRYIENVNDDEEQWKKLQDRKKLEKEMKIKEMLESRFKYIKSNYCS
jgi:hypothetical protein